MLTAEVVREWEFRGGKVNLAEKFVEIQLSGFSEYAVMEYTKSFTDMDQHWAKQDVELMAARHVARGTADAAFSPDASVTRAQFASLLVRSLGLTRYTGDLGTFADASPSAWYFQDVETAARAGLVKGSGGSFSPEALITREEMAVMLGRALTLRKQGVELGTYDVIKLLGAFSDRAETSEWARTDLAAALKLGLVKGRSAETVAPKANTTRAEAIVVLEHSSSA